MALERNSDIPASALTNAGPAEHDTVSRAIGASGLTLAELAGHVLGLPIGRILSQWGHDEPDGAADTSTVGPYLAEFRNGLTRDELAEALDWPLLRVECALAQLDTTLHHSGMRLALNADRTIIVGRLEQTNIPVRRRLERLAAGEVGPKLAAVVWNALPGFAPETTKDIESLKSPTDWGSPAHAKAGSASPTPYALAEPHQQPALTRSCRTDKILAPPLTPVLRTH